MRRIMLIAVFLAVAAMPVRAAETALPALLRFLPQPAPESVWPGRVLLSYARPDLIAGERGPTAAAGHTRMPSLAAAFVPAIGEMPLRQAENWPEGSGFDFDAMDAVLVMEVGRLPRAYLLVAGARVPGIAALNGPLQARGFTLGRIGGSDILTRGDDGRSLLRFARGAEAFGGQLGYALRIAAPAPGVLLAAREDATMAAALAAPAAGQSLADIAEMHALAETSAGGPGARDLAQALVVVTATYEPDPREVLRDGRAALPAADTLAGPPVWKLAMLSERREPARIVTRLAIAYEERAAAEFAAAAMAERFAAMGAMAAAIGISPIRSAVVEQAADGIHVAVAETEQAVGVERTLMQELAARHNRRQPTPMSIGAVPRAALAR